MAAAETEHYAFTINSYIGAADTLYRNGLTDEAEDIFAHS